MKDIIIKDGPFIRTENKTKNIMNNLLIALVPIILFAFYKNGIVPYMNGKVNLYQMFLPLIFIAISVAVTFFTEYLYAILAKKETKNLKHHLKTKYSIFPGLFLALILPINTPIWILIIGALIASIVGKIIFGGLGNNVFNPALVGRLFVIAIFATTIVNSGGYLNSYEVDTISKATPLSNYASVETIGTYDTLVKPYGSLWNFFFGTIPGALGETSAFLCIVGFLYLVYKKALKWRIPITYISTVFIMTYIIGVLNDVGLWYPMFQILSGGLFFGAIFMATDPVTSPTTPIAQVVYGIFLGVLTVVFRFLTSAPEGVLTSILIMNMFVIILDRIGAKARFDLKKIVILILVQFALVLGLSLYIAEAKTYKEEADPNFAIVSKEDEGNKKVYIATQKGFSSTIKAKVTISNNQVEKVEILEQADSFYSKIEETNYADNFKNKSDVSEVDTVSGATITSNAIKKLVGNVLKDYKR